VIIEETNINEKHSLEDKQEKIKIKKQIQDNNESSSHSQHPCFS
jgi:hypothetical protein